MAMAIIHPMSQECDRDIFTPTGHVHTSVGLAKPGEYSVSLKDADGLMGTLIHNLPL